MVAPPVVPARSVRSRGRSRGRGRSAAVSALSVLALLVGTQLVPVGPLAPAPARAATVPLDLDGVQTLYAADLVARVNAERAARNSAGQPVPALAVDPGLAAAAQAWSAHLAALGGVQDPPLDACGPDPSAGQICELAANTGDSGDGFWPGDGSDGMESAYMTSTGHRQNMLNAGYDVVGVGVTCSGGEAWTVELFGFAYGDLGPAEQRQATQNGVEGDPVPVGPSVAGTRTGEPVYCPGQVVGPDGQTTAGGGQYAYPYDVPPVPGEPILTPPDPAVGIADSGATGYWVAHSDGAVDAHGTAPDVGSMAGQPLSAPVSHIVGTPDGRGFWLVGSDGGIFSFGDAAFLGSMGGRPLNAPVVDMASTPDGRGYWLVGSDGGIFAFGDAVFAGSTGGLALNAPIVGMAPTPDGRGYWLVGSDGGIFAFGDAVFAGSTGGLALNAPIVGMAPTPDGHGYWLVGSDGASSPSATPRSGGVPAPCRCRRRSPAWRPTPAPRATGWWPPTAGSSPSTPPSRGRADRTGAGRRPAVPGRSAGPDDRLHLRVGLEAVVAAVASDAGHLEAAEGGLVVALGRVDADVAGPQELGHPEGPGGVAREDVVVEAEVGVVGDGDALLLVVERDGHHHRAEDLLPGHRHVVGPGEQGGGHVEAGVAGARAGRRRRRPRPRWPVAM